MIGIDMAEDKQIEAGTALMDRFEFGLKRRVCPFAAAIDQNVALGIQRQKKAIAFAGRKDF
jgi:hypothetical protein